MPRWFNRARVVVRSILRRKRVDADLNEEMQYHLDHEIQERMRAGLSKKDARRAALLAMGAIEKSKEESRDLWKWPGAAALLQDVRFGLRLFRKHPGPVSIALAGLALAIAVVTAVFSIVNATLLRPYAMDDPSSVVSVSSPGHSAWSGMSYAEFLAMKEGTTLARLEASTEKRVRFSTARAADGTANLPTSFVSGGYLAMLGGRPSLGRSLEPSDDVPNAPPVIVVSHDFWKTALDGDPSAIGKTMWVNDAPVTLVGVVQPDFTGPVEERRALWATLSAYDDLRMGPPVTPIAGPVVKVTARLAPGTGLPALRENLSAIVIRSRGPGEPQAGRPQGVDVYSAASPVSGQAEEDVMVAVALALGVVGLVLALACANTANLLMAAAATRMAEVGIRLAMGASRRRLVTQLIHESLLLGLIAGGFGFALSFWLVSTFGALAALPPEVNLSPDWRALVFTVAVALVCGFAAGLSPARYGARGNVLVALQSQSGSRGAAAVPSKFRMSFIGFQSAVSILLLVLAALLARSAMRMTTFDIGFDADRLVGVSFSVPSKDFDEPGYVRTAMTAIRDLPLVQGVSVIQGHPFSSASMRYRFTHEGRSSRLNVHRSDAGFFAAAGLRILRGRAFTPEEASSEAPVSLVSETAAALLFPGIDPIGRLLSDTPPRATGLREETVRIIGVVGDALMTGIDNENYGAIYRPIVQKLSNPPHLVIRTSTPGAVAREVEDVLRRIDARVRPTTRFIGELVESDLESNRRLAWMLGPIAVFALLLAALGVHGVTAFVVSRRMGEVSVRMALGASAANIRQLLVKDSLRPVVVGLVIGVVLALVSAHAAARHLPGISPHDPLSIVIAMGTLLAFALVAVIVPARRAASADPAALLRQA